MDLGWLRTFLAVAEEGHLRRAAARLSMSPASVSRQLQQLERELGVPLLVRRPRLRLTAAGRAVVNRGPRLLDAWTATINHVREPQHGRARTVVLGIDDFGAGALNLPLVRILREAAAPHQLVVRQLPEQSQFSALASGAVDLVLGGLLDIDPDLDVTVVATQPRGVFLAHDLELAQAPHLRAGDLLDLPFTRHRPGMPAAWTAYWHLHEQRGGPPRLSETTVTDHVTLLTAVGLDGAVGPGNAILGRHLVTPEVTFRALPDLTPAPLSLARRRDGANELLQRLTTAAQVLAAETLTALPHSLLSAPPADTHPARPAP